METPTVEGQSNPLPQVDCNANHNYTNTNDNDNATITITASNNNFTSNTCNDSIEHTAPPNCPIISNNNNNCDSPSSISQRSSVYAYSRNIISNNSPDNYHTNIQDSHNHYDTNYSTNINSICQLDPTIVILMIRLKIFILTNCLTITGISDILQVIVT